MESPDFLITSASMLGFLWWVSVPVSMLGLTLFAGVGFSVSKW